MLDYFLSSLDTAIFLALLVLVIGNIHSLVANIQTKSSDKKVVVLTSVMLVILIAYFILFKYFPSGYPGYYCDTRMNDMQQLRSALIWGLLGSYLALSLVLFIFLLPRKKSAMRFLLLYKIISIILPIAFLVTWQVNTRAESVALRGCIQATPPPVFTVPVR
jgi:hypothetical protein